MIPVIAKHQAIDGIIDYHERKVEKGQGELIFNGTGGSNAEQFKAELNAIGDMKPDSKDRYLHVSLSINAHETLDDQSWNNLVHDYMDAMGYENTPYLIYKHDDKDHPHVHLVMSRVKENGKFIDCYQDHHQSEAAARLLERKYNLKETEYAHKDKASLSEKNAEKYGLWEGLNRLMADDEKGEALRNKLPLKLVESWKESKESGKAMAPYQIMNGFEGPAKFANFNYVKKELEAQNYYKPTKKEVLIEHIDKVKYASKDYEEFKKRLNYQGYYVRELMNKGQRELIIGDERTGMYLNDAQRPKRLSYTALFHIGHKDSTQQKVFIIKAIDKTIAYAVSYDDFKTKLARRGITMREHKNSAGIYGLSFVNTNAGNPMTFKASQLDGAIRYEKFQKILDDNLFERKQFKGNLKRMALERQLMMKKHSLSPFKQISRQLDSGHDSEEQIDQSKGRFR